MRKCLALGLVVCAATGCGVVVEPGHRGLLFNPRRGGLQHEVLGPGYYRVGVYGRIDDFDITYSKRVEEVQTTSKEGLAMTVHVALKYRPVISELYAIDTEIGPHYYEEVVGSEFKSATRGVLSRHSYLELTSKNREIEDEVEAELRKRIGGMHVEVAAVTLDDVSYAPEILAQMRDKIISEQETLRKQTEIENRRREQKLTDDREAEHATRVAEAQKIAKEHERQMAEENAAIEKTTAETEAAVRVTKAKAEAQELSLLAEAHAKEHKAEAVALTPLAVMMHAYDALAKLGGEGTTIMLGDWSHVPNFLFPSVGGFHNPFSGASSEATSQATPRASRRTLASATPVEPRE